MQTNVSNLIYEFFSPISYLWHADERIYWLYCLTSLLIIFVYQGMTKTKKSVLIRNTFRAKYWLNHSTKVDLKWIFINHLLGVIVLSALISGQLGWALSIFRTLQGWFNSSDWFDLPNYIVVGLFTITLFVVDDFSRFFMHYCYHKIPFLWRFHAVHHSAKIMTPLTLYRIHFVEYALNMCRNLVVLGTLSGIFMFLFKGKISAFDIVGVGIFNGLFNLFGANLRHSHAPIRFGIAEHVFISPWLHQVHHSNDKAHLDKNFGSVLAIWDKLFGSFEQATNTQSLRFGLYKQANRQSWLSQVFGIGFTATNKNAKKLKNL